MDDKKPEIISAEYGPFQLVDIDNVYGEDKSKIEIDRVVSFCRCGESKHKPFCDGSHGNAEYVCKKEDDRIPDKVRDYKANDIVIHYNRGICSHDGACTKLLPSVFNIEEKPWITPDGAGIGEIIKVIEKCPSGALSFTLGSKRYQEFGQTEAKLLIKKDGPMEVQGNIELKSFDNSKPECKEHYTLCRCGKSKNKPFCDGTHLDEE